jgi:phospholipid/cholesterol/gamma-HCH transport system ATP-binding protein
MGGQPALERSLAEDFHIAFDGVRLTLGRREVFRGLTCGCLRGKITVVLGGSGAGKSTMLRLIGGLERPDAGSVRVAGEEVNLLPERQLFRVRERIGMLFQGGALLDSMTVFDNVALPLREHTRRSEDEIRERVDESLLAVGLPDVAELFPRHLSGGMSRRAALARSVVMNPEIVLCDEPFSGLDPLNVRRIEALLVDLSRRSGLTLVVTSHHLASSLRMADRIVFLVDGRAVSGSPAELLNNPDHRIVDFLAAESQAEFDTSRLDEESGVRPGAGRGAS